MNWYGGRTFIKALESSPVHCLKPRPWWKFWRPGQAGVRDMLSKTNFSICWSKVAIATHRQSMSSSICLAWALELLFSMYVMIHVTRWSLKQPLISWCSRLGKRSSCMAACGKVFVNGYETYENKEHQVTKRIVTTMSPTRPYSSQSCPNSNSAEMSSVCSLEQDGYISLSRSSAGAVHLDKDCKNHIKWMNGQRLTSRSEEHTSELQSPC